MSNEKKLTTTAGVPVTDNQNVITAGRRGPQLLQDIWFLEKLAHFDRKVIPERRMHAKGSGAYGTFTVTHDITRYTRAKMFSEIGKTTELFARFTTVAGGAGRRRPQPALPRHLVGRAAGRGGGRVVSGGGSRRGAGLPVRSHRLVGSTRRPRRAVTNAGTPAEAALKRSSRISRPQLFSRPGAPHNGCGRDVVSNVVNTSPISGPHVVRMSSACRQMSSFFRTCEPATH